MDYMTKLLALHALAVIVTGISFLGLLYALVGLAGLLVEEDEDA